MIRSLPVPSAISEYAQLIVKNARFLEIKAFHTSGFELGIPHGMDTVFVSARGKGFLPCHIILTQKDYDLFVSDAEPGDIISCPDHGKIRVFNPVFSGRTGYPANKDHLATIYEMIFEKTGGLKLSLKDLLNKDWKGSGAFQHKEGSFSQESSYWLLGRGEGSTPAGDDMLIGALAVHSAYGRLSCLAAYLKDLEPLFDERTTPMSAAYLRYALRGKFGSHLLSLVQHIFSETGPHSLTLRRVNHMMKHGASSGLDTLAGVFLACTHIQ